MRDGVEVPIAGLVCCLFHRIELVILAPRVELQRRQAARKFIGSWYVDGSLDTTGDM
jgi:hypothetical protein